MFRKLTGITVFSAALLFGASDSFADDGKKEKEDHKCEHKGEHKTAHNGILNAIGTCENGHAEVKIDGNTFKLWFVGGGSNTEKAVRIPDKEITLSVVLDGEKEAKPLLLKAKPNELAEEKPGDCSYFEGDAALLKNAKKFVASSSITFKGKKQELKIEYPSGYDPDDDDKAPTK